MGGRGIMQMNWASYGHYQPTNDLAMKFKKEVEKCNVSSNRLPCTARITDMYRFHSTFYATKEEL